MIMRWDAQICLFLMPYIIHNALFAKEDAAREQVKRVHKSSDRPLLHL